ncbi:MAG: glycosyltransferase [Chloroflexota bacterium]|nr:glycosyltransferase [Chloroflexota bacterium]
MTILLWLGAALSLAALGAWLVLLLARGGFWRTDVRLPVSDAAAQPSEWPSLAIVVPARNESEVLPHTLPALLAQDYPGELHVYLVDDESDDATADFARTLADQVDDADRLTVIRNKPRPAGWMGKTWAMHAGVNAALGSRPEFILLTDADIRHPPNSARTLLAAARANDFDLVSQMAMLRVASRWDHLLIPAFVMFFGMIFPFRWSNDPKRGTAAAAGGCVLVRADALARAGGVASIAGAVIDDCALARRIKDHGRPHGGRTWLGLSREVRSVRRYRGLAEIWSMVARSAFAQLDHSAWRLVGTVIGLLLVFVWPPVATILGAVALASGAAIAPAALLLASGLAAWGLMTASQVPMLRWYGTPAPVGLALPFTAALYTLMTIDSARLHWSGEGGRWRGRRVGGR